MIPKVNSDLLTLEAETRRASRTWKLNTGAGTIAGTADEKDAMIQAIYLILSTERYQYLIYGWDYGIETGDLIGRPPDYVQSELKRRIREALMWDDRVTAVDGFSFTVSHNQVRCTFTVSTIFGDVKADREVTV